MVADLLLHRAAQALKEDALTPEATTLVLVGHGSIHDPASANTLAMQRERIRAASAFRSIMTAFISQPPFLRDVLAVAHQPVIVMAVFTARGNHIIEDVERLFIHNGNNDVFFLGAVGEDDEFVAVIEGMVGEELGMDEQGTFGEMVGSQ